MTMDYVWEERDVTLAREHQSSDLKPELVSNLTLAWLQDTAADITSTQNTVLQIMFQSSLPSPLCPPPPPYLGPRAVHYISTIIYHLLPLLHTGSNNTLQCRDSMRRWRS